MNPNSTDANDKLDLRSSLADWLQIKDLQHAITLAVILVSAMVLEISNQINTQTPLWEQQLETLLSRWTHQWHKKIHWTKKLCKTYLNWCDFIEVLGVWNTKAAHPMLMAPFLEMPFKSPTAPVTVVPTYLTLKFLKCIKKNAILWAIKNPIKYVAHGRHQFLIEKELLLSVHNCTSVSQIYYHMHHDAG